ncbi:uncharacterized protein LOC142982377 [Anticarsia gemmatalis]|uniref:uncharacterized protein LOC142982377 n=1 Tax=Anticarsia gemmatalis TaxID=129554 RepID=UPI003F772E68
MAAKRLRGENWLEEDKIILKQLVKERVSILENKNTDTKTNSKKVAAWQDLLTNFNNVARTQRTLQQIKAQWNILKMAAKKRKFQERINRTHTGGGTPPPFESPTSDDISVWLPGESIVETNKMSPEIDNQHKQKEETISEPYLMPITNSTVVWDISEGKETKLKLEQYIIEDQLCTSTQAEQSTSTQAESSTSTRAESSTSTQTTAKTKPKIPHYRLRNKKISNINRNSAVKKIPEMETECRIQLHEAQMLNEKQKLKNLLLKEEVLKFKLLYYKNKLN